ncbi:MAG: hypothetical protein ABI196_00680 [Bradyrhizobium sp.]
MRRRKFLAAAMAATVGLSTWARAQILRDPLGRPVTVGGYPIQPTIVSTGGLLNQQVVFYSPTGMPSQTNPLLQFGMPIARSELPASGFKPALYDATGTTFIQDLQIDQSASGWSDGSINYAVLTGYGTGTTIAGGGNGTFRVKAIAGSPSNTPVCTLAQLASGSDIKAVVKVGTSTNTVSVNTILATYGGIGGSGNAQGYVYQWKVGPKACQWEFGQWLQDDSSGAFHRWFMVRLYVTALSPSGPFIVSGELAQSNAYGPNASGTVGPTQYASINVADSIEIFDGATRIGVVCGPNDTRNGTFTPANVALGTSASIAVTSGIVGYCAAGFSSTGTLPAGLSATGTYWPWTDSSGHVVPMLKKGTLYLLYNRNILKVVPVNGLAVTTTKYCVANGAYYICTIAGTSSGQLPTGSVFTDSNGVQWTALSAQMTSTGTGTHTMVLKATTCAWTKVPFVGTDTYPFWSGAGSLPKFGPGYDFTYLTQKTKSMLRLDPANTANVVGWIGPIDTFVHNTPVDIPIFIAQTGESLNDERVDIVSNSAICSIHRPDDPGFLRHIRNVALSFMDRQYYMRDERSHTIVSHNYGPARNGLTNYPNMGPLNPLWHNQSGGVSPAGSPKGGVPFDQIPADFYGYGQFDSADNAEASHNPNPFYWPALTSGEPMFFNAMMEYFSAEAGVTGAGNSLRSWTNGGLSYTFAYGTQQQMRGAGHQFKTAMQTEWLLADAHPAKALLSDIMDDTSNQLLNWLKATESATAIANGWPNLTYPSVGTLQNIEPWMLALLIYPMAWSAWQGNRNGFLPFIRDFLNILWLNPFDTDTGGTEKAIDAQDIIVANGLSSQNPPLDKDWIPSMQTRLDEGTHGAYTGTTYPPPANLFIRGLQQSPSSTYVYWQPPGPINANTYMLLSRATLAMCAAAGIPQSAKVFGRVNALLALSGVPQPGWVLTAAQAPTGNRNGLMYESV